MSNLDRYYIVLELEPGDSVEKVKQAYRDLAFVWHPDRYSNHPRLQAKAQEKLKILNEAHDQLEDLLRHQPRLQTSPVPAPPAPPTPPAPPAPARSQLNIELL